ncbi:MAG: BMP family ABC transporter substrate-binding protein, partial [Oscillospiraceae bacterium]|nr:BMP family ABC transporter substrate-binding protein [Oscillospiraceae bacterium]
MDLYDANTEYKNALKAGQREYRALTAKGLDPHPRILEKLLDNVSALPVQTIGIREIPIERIVGVKTEGRITAFSASFMPLLEPGTEFAAKWISLCADHLSDTGIRDPIECYEYLGDFYVQEGNKRLSVLRHFGAPSIMASIKRILPPQSDEPRIRAYYEFLDFYKNTELYLVQYKKPGDYAKLLAYLGKKPDEVWSEQDRRTFSTYFHYFQKAFDALDAQQDVEMQPEDALLLWLNINRFERIGELSAAELKKSLSDLWDDVRVGAPVQVTEVPEEAKKGLIESIISPNKSHIQVAFVHQRDVEISPWTKAHEQAREYLDHVLADRVTTRSYFNADTVEAALSQIEQAVLDGAEVVFTTTPSLLRPTLRMAVNHPKVRFFNCSADVPFSSVHGYYCRAFEGKFITGAIAGAMTKGDEIGYIASYPILGVPASINAFALGAQMTNPDARIILRWSCVAGDPLRDFLQQGV